MDEDNEEDFSAPVYMQAAPREYRSTGPDDLANIGRSVAMEVSDAFNMEKDPIYPITHRPQARGESVRVAERRPERAGLRDDAA